MGNPILWIQHISWSTRNQCSCHIKNDGSFLFFFFLSFLCLASNTIQVLMQTFSTTYWQSFIWTGTFSWPSSLCSTMKSFGFIPCSVIKSWTTKEELSHGKCETYAGQHALWVSRGQIHFQLGSWKTGEWLQLFKNCIQYFAGKKRKQWCDFRTSAPGDCGLKREHWRTAAGWWTDGRGWGRQVSVHMLTTDPPWEGSSRKCLRWKFLPWHKTPMSGPQHSDLPLLKTFSYYVLAKFDFRK